MRRDAIPSVPSDAFRRRPLLSHLRGVCERTGSNHTRFALAITFAVHAFVVDIGCVSLSSVLPFHLLLTRAYDVTLTF